MAKFSSPPAGPLAAGLERDFCRCRLEVLHLFENFTQWKFDFSSREWMHCLVECKQLGSAGSMWCNMFSGRQQTRARKRVLNRTLHSNTQDTLQGGYTFFYSGFVGYSAL